MKISTYSRKAKQTAVYPISPNSLYESILGVVGESGEVFEAINNLEEKGIDEVIMELGDVLWYLSDVCSVLRIPFLQIAQRWHIQITTFQDYQSFVDSHINSLISKKLTVILLVEAARIAEYTKKVLRGHVDIFEVTVQEEFSTHLSNMFDTISMISTSLYVDLDNVACTNIRKLTQQKDKRIKEQNL